MIDRRWVVYGVALAGAAALVLFGNRTPEVAAAAAARPAVRAIVASKPASRGRAEADVPFVALRERATLFDGEPARAQVRDLFAGPPSPAPPKAAVATPLPAPPQAPPIPFIVLGKRHDGEQWDVFLQRAGYTFIVRRGSTIEDTYRVDAVEPPTLTLVYLPLSQAQTIAIGAAD